jgi:hypothetical protein
MNLDPSIEREEIIETTTRFAALPNPITGCPYNIHDVASTFKHFLGELHGGILGSVDLFESVRKALGMAVKETTRKQDDDWDFSCRGIATDDEKANLRWVASSLANVECAQRRNLIFAVFGLLAHVKHDRARPRDSFLTPPRRHSPQMDPAPAFGFAEAIQDRCAKAGLEAENMSSNSLATVFAPLLLGTLTDEIRIDPAGPAGGQATPSRHHGSPRPTVERIASMAQLQHVSLGTRSGTDLPKHTNSAIDLPHSLSGGDSNITPPILVPLSSFSTALPRDVPKGAWKIRKQVKRQETLDALFLSELEEARLRNEVSLKMCELLIRNWEGVVMEVKAMRRIGNRYGSGRC